MQLKTERLASSGRRRVATATLLCFLVCACTPPPDVTPFAHRTKALGQGVSASLDAVAGEVGAIDADLGRRFERELAPRIAMMGALVQYADAIARLSRLAQPGSDAADDLGDAVVHLAAVFETSVPGPYAEVASMVLDAIENVRAHKGLADAVEAADPAIQGTAALLIEELGDLHALLQQTKFMALQEYKKGHEALVDQMQELENTRLRLRHELFGSTDAMPPTLDDSFFASNSEKLDRLGSVNAMIAALEGRLSGRRLTRAARSWRSGLRSRIASCARRWWRWMSGAGLMLASRRRWRTVGSSIWTCWPRTSRGSVPSSIRWRSYEPRMAYVDDL